MLVGGVGVANAVKSHLDRRRDVIATLKSLGATGSTVFAIYLTQVVTLALIGALPGLLVGAALPFLIAWGFGALLPLPLAPAIHPAGLALAMLYGVLTAVAFGLWPLGRAHDVPVSALFRDTVAGVERWPRRSYVVATALVVSALAAIAIELAFDRRIAVIFVVAAAGVFVLLRLVAALLMMLARRAPRLRSPVVRLAIANIHRPGALTPSVVLSLGLGLALLVTVIEIDGNLRRQFMAALPDKAPSFYFIDIPAADAEKFDAFVQARVPGATLRASSDVARTHPGGARRSCRRTQAAARYRLGPAKRSRHYLRRRNSGRVAGGRRRRGGSRTIGARRWCRSRSGSPTGLA